MFCRDSLARGPRKGIRDNGERQAVSPASQTSADTARPCSCARILPGFSPRRFQALALLKGVNRADVAFDLILDRHGW